MKLICVDHKALWSPGKYRFMQIKLKCLFLVSGKIQKTQILKPYFAWCSGRKEWDGWKRQHYWSPSGWHPGSSTTARGDCVGICNMLMCEVKNWTYLSGESCICQVYCFIKPIHLSTHWMPIKIAQDGAGIWWAVGAKLYYSWAFLWRGMFHPAKWQAYQSQIKCSWNNAFKEDENAATWQ